MYYKNINYTYLPLLSVVTKFEATDNSETSNSATDKLQWCGTVTNTHWYLSVSFGQSLMGRFLVVKAHSFLESAQN